MSSTFPGVPIGTALHQLAFRQRGVLSRAQLAAHDVGPSEIAAQLAARRWQELGPLVLALHNGPVTRLQWLHAAVLHVGSKGCLAARTALEPYGFRGFDDHAIHLLHPRATSVPRLSGLRVHESRRLHPGDVTSHEGLHVTVPARSAIDAVAFQRFPRFAYALPAAVVQQGLSTPLELGRELRRAGQVRHAEHLRPAIADIAGGAESLGEIDLASLCRRHRLRPPARQRIRHDRRGRRRYLDAEWDLPDGRSVVLEVDGDHHMAVAHWTADMKRERRVVIGRRSSVVLRCSAREVRLDHRELAEDLVAAGVVRLPIGVVTVSSTQGSTSR